MALHDVLQVVLDLLLGDVVVRPWVCYQQLLVEAVSVHFAERVAVGSGVFASVPCATNVGTLFDQLDGESQFAEFVELVDSGKASTNNQGVDRRHVWRLKSM